MEENYRAIKIAFMEIKIEETYCVYCRRSEKEIRRENRRAGYRVPCRVRDTKEGFHSYGYRVLK